MRTEHQIGDFVYFERDGITQYGTITKIQSDFSFGEFASITTNTGADVRIILFAFTREIKSFNVMLDIIVEL